MTGSSYAKGYRFERKTKKHLESKGWFVIRQGKSAFPDLIAIKNSDYDSACKVRLIECKNQERPKTYYLSRGEKDEFKEIKNKFPAIKCQVAYKIQDPDDGRKKLIKFDDLYENKPNT